MVDWATMLRLNSAASSLGGTIRNSCSVKSIETVELSPGPRFCNVICPGAGSSMLHPSPEAARRI